MYIEAYPEGCSMFYIEDADNLDMSRLISGPFQGTAVLWDDSGRIVERMEAHYVDDTHRVVYVA